MTENVRPTLQDLMLRREDLDEELVPFIQKATLGDMLNHPLVQELIYVPEMNAVLNYRLKIKKEEVALAYAAKEWAKVIYLHERPYRLSALHQIAVYGYIESAEEYWPLVIEFWMDSENIHQNYDEWIDLWSAEDMGCPRTHGMEETEIAALEEMDDEITIYRVIGHEDYVRGLSWTVDRHIAIGIFGRHPNARLADRKPLLVVGKTKKTDVLVYLEARGEAEIVVLPDNVVVESTTIISDDDLRESANVIRQRREKTNED